MIVVNRILLSWAVLAAGLLVVMVRLPHLHLAACLTFGYLDGRQIPIVDMPSTEFPTDTRPLSCGVLRLEAPIEATIGPESPDESCGFHLKSKGLWCRVPPPRHQPDEWNADTTDWIAELDRCGIDRQASVCATSSEDFSFWTSSRRVESLRRQLEAKMYLCSFAERIEIVRNENLCGLLLMWGLKNQPRMRIEYFTPDQQICGTLLISLDEPTPEAMDMARAIVSSLQVERVPDDQAKSNDAVAAAGQIRPRQNHRPIP